MGLISDCIAQCKENREYYWNVYLNEGQEGFAKCLGIAKGSTTHVLKALGFSKQDVLFKRKLNKDFVSSSVEDSYFLGYFLGDGNMHLKNGRHWNLNISSSDKDHLESMQTKYPEFRLRSLGRGCYALDLNSNLTALKLLNLGFAPSKSVNGCILDLSNINILKFLLGLLDSDGCVRYGNKGSSLVVEWVGHASYMNQVYHSLCELGYSPTYRKNRQGLVFVSMFRKNEQIDLREKMYCNADLFLKRKYERFYSIF